jgi:exodeoxyribonuclease VII small subunit
LAGESSERYAARAMAERKQPPPHPRSPRAIEADSSDSEVDSAGEPMPDPDPEPSFETALDRLEALVAGLETGELSLEEALTGFEEGVRLSRRLADQLGAAERRIERLTQEGGVLTTRPLHDEGEGE